MKQILLFALALVILFSACRVFGRLTSTTQIEPSQSFVLGEGNHGSYKATVKNISQSDVEVFKMGDNGTAQSLGILSKGDSQRYEVPQNTMVSFKNLGNAMAFIQINLVGDTNLSMGYQKDKK